MTENQANSRRRIGVIHFVVKLRGGMVGLFITARPLYHSATLPKGHDVKGLKQDLGIQAK